MPLFSITDLLLGREEEEFVLNCLIIFGLFDVNVLFNGNGLYKSLYYLISLDYLMLMGNSMCASFPLLYGF